MHNNYPGGGRIAPRHIVLVGCGGGASYLLPVLVRTVRTWLVPPTIHLVDKDILEVRNLDRQQFTTADVGRPKAEALAERHLADRLEHQVHVSWFTAECALAYRLEEPTLYFNCADNHPARAAILTVVDRHRRHAAIIGGNETTDSDAYFYRREWRNHDPLDPRLRFPELLTDKSGSSAGAEGCTGEAAVDERPQLPTANHLCAGGMLWLMQFWTDRHADILPGDLRPYQFRSTLFGCESSTLRNSTPPHATT